jgi:hypothetical protein
MGALILTALGVVEAAGVALLIMQRPRPAYGPPLRGHRRKTDTNKRG